MIKKINVRLLGGFSVTIDGCTVIENATKLTKPWQLFVYVLMKNGEVISAEELITVLWAEEELADAANVLKNTVYALRKEMAGKTKPSDSPIVYRNGGYSLNFCINFTTDVGTMCEMYAKGESPKSKKPMPLFEVAVSAYTGDFLPMLDTEPWALMYARRFKNIYVSSAHKLCQLLEAENEWDELLNISTHLNLVEPLNEIGYLYTFRALLNKQMYKAIVTTYNKTSRFFQDELNLQLCEEIKQIHDTAQEHVNKIELDFMIIKDELQCVLNTDIPMGGALFCSYDAFKRMFLLMSRSAARNKAKIDLFLFTIEDKKGGLPLPSMLNIAMEDLKMVLGANLRKSDTCCRYSRRQFATLTMTTEVEVADKIIARIRAQFALTESGKHTVINCKTNCMHINE